MPPVQCAVLYFMTHMSMQHAAHIAKPKWAQVDTWGFPLTALLHQAACKHQQARGQTLAMPSSSQDIGMLPLLQCKVAAW
jgi:hypothetical protein